MSAIRNLFIWWHRRRAAYHEAAAAYCKSEGHYPEMNRHLTWMGYHKRQIERLQILKLSPVLGE